MSAPVYQTADDQHVAGATAANITFTKPSGLADGDLLVIHLYKENHNAVTAPGTGWVQGTSEVNCTVASHAYHAYYFYKPITNAAGEAGTYQFTWSGSVWREGTIARISGANLSNPIHVETSAVNGGSSASSPAVSVTPTIDNCLILHMYQNFNGGTWTPNTGYTEQLDAAGSDIGWSYKAQTTAGAESNIVAVCTGSDSGRGAILIAIAPAAGGAFTLTADPATYSVTGSAAVPKAARVTAANPGTYTTTGSSAGTKVGRKVAATPGAYSTSGSAMAPKATRVIPANPGVYGVTGSAAITRLGRKIAATPGSYLVSGSNAALKALRNLLATPGVYGLTGSPATLTYSPVTGSYTLIADPGVYGVTGSAAGLKVGRKIAAVPGSYAILGSGAVVAATRRIVAVSGNYGITGSAAALKIARKIAAASGAYLISGSDATLVPPVTGSLSHGLIRISNFQIALNVKREVDSGRVDALASDVGGTQVTFNKSFKDVDSLTCTVESTTEPFVVIYDFADVPNPTEFFVYVFDTTGNRVSKTVTWKARGIV